MRSRIALALALAACSSDPARQAVAPVDVGRADTAALDRPTVDTGADVARPDEDGSSPSTEQTPIERETWSSHSEFESPHLWAASCFHDGRNLCREAVARHPARRPRMPTVRSSLPTVSGQLPPEAIRRVAFRSLGQVHHCYVQALAERPTVAGRVEIRFVIDGNGVVIASEVTRASMSATEPGRCIAAAVRRWRFPAPADGDKVTVSAPFDLALDDEAPQRQRARPAGRRELPTMRSGWSRHADVSTPVSSRPRRL